MPQSRILIHDFEKVQSINVDEITVNEVVNEPKSNYTIKIDFDDVKDDITYWENMIVCYVIGANPPF